MLKRLADKHPDFVSQLTYQYRMHKDICQLSNDVVYKGKLKCANDLVANKILKLVHFPFAFENYSNKESLLWLTKAIDPSNAVSFLDTDMVNDKPNNPDEQSKCFLESSNNRRSGIVNEAEAFIVISLIKGLVTCGLDVSSIGVISPFRAQLRLLDEHESIHNWVKEGLEVSTIDRFQGRDKSVIILSFVRSNTKGKVGHLLEDFRRLNVAVTRAKYKLIMVGSYSTLYKGSGALKLVLDRVVVKNHLIQLPSYTSIPSIPRITIN